ncbi:MAG TPA: hypothetical protein VD735_03740 [Candidatus Saccharimonadales bacterium]|nr:hypothetical protein [Candidatus Saccharimonadales bacterium]
MTAANSTDKKVSIKYDGVELLQDVARQPENTTGLVFHGSHHMLARLEPRPVYWKDANGLTYPDSEVPVVCASDKPFIPTFLALLPRETDWRYISNGKNQGLTYYIAASAQGAFEQASGYVLVLDGEHFAKTVPPIPKGWKYDMPIGGRQAEMRSEQSVATQYAIKVTYADFETLLRLDGNSRLEYRS